ncbi:MAG: LD-carboxypeptidase, partial [Firmicutes bacterium]|nr:LD-carboxypeptidase [Bacillota bacterium]
AAEINDFFTGRDCAAVLSVGGGETMCEDLSFVDFEKISRSKPRWFMGYSDNTNLTFTLPTICDTAAVYGPCAGEFAMKPLHPAVEDAFAVLTGEKLALHSYPSWEKDALKSAEDPFAPYNATEPGCIRVFGPDGSELLEGESADFSGRLLGGCLDILQILCGTRFDRVLGFCERYRRDGVVWFLESCDLQPVAMRRALWQLDEAGWFRTARGFIIGRPWFFDAETFGLDRFSAVLPVLEKYYVPVVFDADIGHLPPMMPVVCGAVGSCLAQKGSLTIDQRFI